VQYSLLSSKTDYSPEDFRQLYEFKVLGWITTFSLIVWGFFVRIAVLVLPF